MNLDEFERELKRRPMRTVPNEWRREVLSRARREQMVTNTQAIKCWWRELLWPSPRAWASLAATWAIILILNAGSREPSATAAANSRGTFHSPELLAILERQQQLRSELMESPTVMAAEQKPRSQMSRDERKT
jgi:hypothetical protein